MIIAATDTLTVLSRVLKYWDHMTTKLAKTTA